MRISLIQPTPRGDFDRHWARVPGLGLGYVAASLRAAGHEVEVLDGKLGRLTTEQITARVHSRRPDLVGVTCMTVEFPRAVEIARRIKADRSDVPIVVGGAHANAVGSGALEEAPELDFACVGEGEGVMCDLAAALADGETTAGIAGLVSRVGGRLVAGPPRPFRRDLDELPFPAWDLFRLGDTVPVITHRGCPFRCTFCSHNSGFTPRYRTPANVLEELRHVVARYRPDRIRFEDETFGLHVRRTTEILEGIIAAGFHRRVRFSAQTRVDRIDEEFVLLLKKANFETLELGVESGNAEILRAIRKGITIEQVEHAVTLAKRNGLRVWCKFILGHPNETPETIEDTIALITRLNPEQLSVSLMTPFPGTPIHELAVRGEGGYRLLASGWEDFDKYSSGVLELETVSLGKLKRYQIACYLSLYLRNGRVGELARLAASERAVGWELVRAATIRTALEGLGACRRPFQWARPRPVGSRLRMAVGSVRRRRRDAVSGRTGKPPRLPPRWFIRTAWKVHRGLYRGSGGRLGLWRPKPGGWGTLRLTATGRRSGRPRSVILGYLRDGPNLVTLAMNGWGEAEPAWWLNLQANPEATVVTRDGKGRVRARAALGEEREQLWARWREIDGELDGFAARRPRETTVVVLEPLGDGSP